VPEKPDRNAIEVVNVSKIFGSGEGQVAALDTVSVSIRENEFFTLLGPSGCGKTTLLRTVAGFVRQDRGRVLIDGTAIDDLPPNRRRVGIVFQNYALFPHMSVAQNVGYALTVRRMPAAEKHSAVQRALPLPIRKLHSHRLDHEEFSSGHTFADFESAMPALAAWEHHYNYERFSLALQGHTPAETLELRLPLAQSA